MNAVQYRDQIVKDHFTFEVISKSVHGNRYAVKLDGNFVGTVSSRAGCNAPHEARLMLPGVEKFVAEHRHMDCVEDHGANIPNVNA